MMLWHKCPDCGGRYWSRKRHIYGTPHITVLLRLRTIEGYSIKSIEDNADFVHRVNLQDLAMHGSRSAYYQLQAYEARKESDHYLRQVAEL